MRFLSQTVTTIGLWIDSVAKTVNSLVERMRPQRRVRLIEEQPDTFTFQLAENAKNASLPAHRARIVDGSVVGTIPPKWMAILHGSRIELILQPSRFFFRPLELPKRAADYLDGIVRAQIDRLTPWTASEAMYSWTPPTEASNDRIHLTIAATAQSLIAPYLSAIATLNAASTVIATVPAGVDPQASPIKIFEQRTRSAATFQRIRISLLAILLLSGLSTAAAVSVSAVATSGLDAEQQELLRKISARKAALRNLFEGSALRALEKRKQTTPSSVIALEALSTLLPDDTYVTELRIDGEKLQIVGMTSDAPSLIRLIEKSPHFARATFFAPTTRSLGTAKEQFHIESHINPVFTFGS